MLTLQQNSLFCLVIDTYVELNELMDVGLSMADILNTLLDFSPRVKSLMHVRRLY